MTDPVPVGLLDTSAAIDLGALDPADLPDECVISAITLAELSVGALVATNPRQREARQAHLQQAEADFEPLPFDAACARTFGRVAASSLRRSGRKPAARAYDALIAATALTHELPVYTRNPDDFAARRPTRRRADGRGPGSPPTRPPSRTERSPTALLPCARHRQRDRCLPGQLCEATTTTTRTTGTDIRSRTGLGHPRTRTAGRRERHSRRPGPPWA